jgi:hypothetical protein
MDGRISRFARLIPLLGATLPVMMSVGPGDAELNLCKWVSPVFGAGSHCLHGLPPTLLASLGTAFAILGAVWFFWPNARQTSTRRPAPDTKINLALDYIVNDSDAKLKQPRKPYISQSGPHAGRLVHECGVQHNDARAQLNSRLVAGELQAWGRRQIVCPMPNQFEDVLRPIPADYWDTALVDFHSCLSYIDRYPQTMKIPGKPEPQHWTAIMLSREQVVSLWPRKSTSARFWEWISRKPPVKAKPDLKRETD